MQGQRSTINSFPDSYEFDRGTSSSNTVAEEQIWNNILTPVETRLPAYLLSPSETNITYGNVANHDGCVLSGWNSGGPQSTENTRNHVPHDGMKMEEGWSSLGTRAETGSRFEERPYELASMLSLESVNINLSSNHVANGHLFLRNSNSDIPQNINLNAGYEGSGQVMETRVCPHLFKSGGSEIAQIPSMNHPTYPFGTASGSGGHIVEEGDSRRLSCKRKALEGASGQSSIGGSSSCFQEAENCVLHSVPTFCDTAGSSSGSTLTENFSVINPPEQLNTGLGVGTGVASNGHPVLDVAAGNGESSQRNFRMRINPASIRSATRCPNVWSPHQQSRLLPFNHSMDPMPNGITQLGNTNPLQSQSHIMPILGLPQIVHPFPLNGASISRVGSSSSTPAFSGDRGVAVREEAFSRSIPRYISEHPLFIHTTEMRNLARDPTNWISADGNISIPGNVNSTSRVGTSSGILPSALTWVPHHNPPHPQRLSEFALRPVFQSNGFDSGGQGISFPPLCPSPFVSSQEILLPAGADHQGLHQPYIARSALRMDRHSDGVLGVPLSLRSLAAANEGRSRLVSEIRNVLDHMRRGASLTFEDVLFLDPSIFYGVTELRDRHRDMRLDVDNMSYEELLALEEHIGNVSTGLSIETIMKCLKQRKYSSITIGTPSEIEPCCICREEYIDGEDLGTLDCGHDFHTGCIKQWLMLKNLCPICKTAALVS